MDVWGGVRLRGEGGGRVRCRSEGGGRVRCRSEGGGGVRWGVGVREGVEWGEVLTLVGVTGAKPTTKHAGNPLQPYVM